MTQLTQHFTLEELTASRAALADGIDNSIPKELLSNLTITAHFLEMVRGVLRRPIIVSSGYRCAALNALVGGDAKSDHMLGLAADFICPLFGTPLEICRALIESPIKYDKLIWECEAWVHLSVGPAERRLVMTKHMGKPYMEGLVFNA